MEGYHVMKTHPQLQRSVPDLYNARYGNDTGGVGVPINPNQSMRDKEAGQNRKRRPAARHSRPIPASGSTMLAAAIRTRMRPKLRSPILDLSAPMPHPAPISVGRVPSPKPSMTTAPPAALPAKRAKRSAP